MANSFRVMVRFFLIVWVKYANPWAEAEKFVGYQEHRKKPPSTFSKNIGDKMEKLELAIKKHGPYSRKAKEDNSLVYVQLYSSSISEFNLVHFSQTFKSYDVEWTKQCSNYLKVKRRSHQPTMPGLENKIEEYMEQRGIESDVLTAWQFSCKLDKTKQTEVENEIKYIKEICHQWRLSDYWQKKVGRAKINEIIAKYTSSKKNPPKYKVSDSEQRQDILKPKITSITKDIWHKNEKNKSLERRDRVNQLAAILKNTNLNENMSWICKCGEEINGAYTQCMYCQLWPQERV